MTTAQSNCLGDFIKLRRKIVGLNQRDIGKRTKVSPQSVSYWENGKLVPSIEKLVPLAAALQTEVETLIEKRKESLALKLRREAVMHEGRNILHIIQKVIASEVEIVTIPDLVFLVKIQEDLTEEMPITLIREALTARHVTK